MKEVIMYRANDGIVYESLSAAVKAEAIQKFKVNYGDFELCSSLACDPVNPEEAVAWLLENKSYITDLYNDLENAEVKDEN